MVAAVDTAVTSVPTANSPGSKVAVSHSAAVSGSATDLATTSNALASADHRSERIVRHSEKGPQRNRSQQVVIASITHAKRAAVVGATERVSRTNSDGPLVRCREARVFGGKTLGANRATRAMLPGCSLRRSELLSLLDAAGLPSHNYH
jgi:hypothetical protein